MTTPCVCPAKHSVMWSRFSPSLRPPGVRALLSPGQVFLLAVIDTSSSTLSARAPSIPLGRRSTRTRWVSVPPGRRKSMRFCRSTSLTFKHLITPSCHTYGWIRVFRFSIRKSIAWHLSLLCACLIYAIYTFYHIRPKKAKFDFVHLLRIKDEGDK